MIQLLMLACSALLAVSVWFSDALPPPEKISAELAAEPLQTPTHRAPFQTTVNGVTYTVKPVFEYELVGLVVSKHNADVWWDSFHEGNLDNLNVTDLCVLWGDNALRGRYKDIHFSSSQFTCNFETRSQQAYEQFNQAQVSNNHLLTDDAAIAKRLKGARIGDQIYFKGVLAEYSHHQGNGFFRGTSTVRTDTGNGACETVYVTQAQILQRANPLWRYLMWLACGGLLLSVGLWFAAPVRAG